VPLRHLPANLTTQDVHDGVSLKKQTPVNTPTRNVTLVDYLKFMKEVLPKMAAKDSGKKGYGGPATAKLHVSSVNEKYEIQEGKVWVVMGEKEAGLDSFASALVFAQYQAEISDIPVIPLVNFKKKGPDCP
jgi:hypothetical protein